MIRAAFLAALLAGTAHAGSLASWTPGGNPCLGTCSLEWALAQFAPELAAPFAVLIAERVPPHRMTIPAGALIVGMAEGGPHWIAEPMVSAADQPASGWRYGGWAFVTFEACGNPALIWMGEEDATSAWAPVVPAWFAQMAGRRQGLYSWGWHSVGGISLHSMPGEIGRAPLTPPPVAPAAVPLPPSLLMLASVGLMFRRTRWMI